MVLLSSCSSNGHIAQGSGDNQVWLQFFEKPSDWWDVRRNPQVQYDFKHHRTGHILLVASPKCPDWVLEDLKLLKQPDTKCRAQYKIDADILAEAKECRDTVKGRILLSRAIERGLLVDTPVSNQFIHMFMRCAAVEEARDIFDKIAEHNVVSWNTMIKGYVTAGRNELALELFETMEGATGGSCVPDGVTFVAALSSCANLANSESRSSWLEKGKGIHSWAVMSSCRDNHLDSSLLHMYAKFRKMEYAQVVFDEMVQPSVVCWNALIQGYINNAEDEKAIANFEALTSEGACIPDEVTFLVAVSACGNLADRDHSLRWLEKGKAIYSQAVISSCSNSNLESNLVHLFGKFGKVVHSQALFDGMVQTSTVSWNTLIQGYVKSEQNELALEIFETMVAEAACAPNAVTFIVALSACANLADEKLGEHNPKWLEKGKAVHSFAIMSSKDGDLSLKNILVHFYGKFGKMNHAQVVFVGIPQPDTVSWTALIQGYVTSGQNALALEVFDAMAEEAACFPTMRTIVVALSACADLAGEDSSSRWLEKGKAIHSLAVRSNYSSIFLDTSLVHMYAMFGKTEYSQVVFDGIVQPDTVCWNALIAGYLHSGENHMALRYSSLMDLSGVQHSTATFAAVIKACGNLVAAQTITVYHAEIQAMGLEQDPELVVCLVDIYGKSGCMDLAREVFDSAVLKSTVTWNALLNGYRLNGETENAFQAFEDMKEQKVALSGITFICLLKLCSHAGLYEKGKELFDSMKREYGIDPINEHYSCMVDLLVKGNMLEEAVRFIRDNKADVVLWSSVLAGSHMWKNPEIEKVAHQNLASLSMDATHSK